MCESRWLTCAELELQGVSRSTALRYGPLLSGRKMAHRTSNGHGLPSPTPWLFHPDALDFLLSRSVGRPRMAPTEQEVSDILRLWEAYGYVDPIRKELERSWHVVERWLDELGLRQRRQDVQV